MNADFEHYLRATFRPGQPELILEGNRVEIHPESCNATVLTAEQAAALARRILFLAGVPLDHGESPAGGLLQIKRSEDGEAFIIRINGPTVSGWLSDGARLNTDPPRFWIVNIPSGAMRFPRLDLAEKVVELMKLDSRWKEK